MHGRLFRPGLLALLTRSENSRRNRTRAGVAVSEAFLRRWRYLERMRYPGYVNLEYEIDENDPLPGMKQSFGYMRGVLAALAA